jgi:6,7-dimethyl-8-ribityllumazine synthase
MIKIPSSLNGAGLRIGVVQSRFNEHVVNKMVAACVTELVNLGVVEDDIEHVSVAGALEIPQALHTMAVLHRYDAMVAIGAVIRGETYHFEVVSNESCRGVMQVALETAVPIANGILTVDTDEQALARVEEKGTDCAKVAVEMGNLMRALAERDES